MRIGINALGALSKDTGGRTYLYNFIRTCVALKVPHEFFIFYSGPNQDLWGELPANYHKIALPGTDRSSIWKVWGEQVLLPLKSLQMKLDVFYFPGNFVAPLVFNPKVVAIRSALRYYYPDVVPPVQRFYRNVLGKFSARLARRIVVPSASIRSDVERFMPAARGKITVLPHGVDTNHFSRRAGDAEIERQLAAMGVKRPFFLFVSALWPYKGAHQFVDALQRLRDRTGRTELTAVLAGQGIASSKYYQEIQQHVAQHGLENAVHFVGQRSHDDLAILYWAAEALVFPSYIESFGNPLVEAMAAGTPVIASNRHAIPETVGNAALIVDPDDVEGMSVAMERILTDVPLREQLVVAGRERAKHFQWPRAVQGVLDILQEAAAPVKSDQARPTILMFGYLPPPVFGPSTAYSSLLRSEFVRRFDVKFINLSVVKNIRNLEEFRLSKVWKLGSFLVQELWCLLTKRPALCVCPIAYNRRAFLKDSLLMGLARAFQVPVVVWAHGMGAPQFWESLSPRLRRRFDRDIQNAAGVVVLANCLRAEFSNWVPPERVHTVNIGVEPVAYLPSSPPHPNRLTVLYLGNLSRTKGVFDLLKAMPLVRQRNPQVRLVMAGEWFRADEEVESRRLVQELGLEDVVEWPGPVYEAAKWSLFRSADLFVFPSPSRYEAYGIVLLEAMQAGLPIVATRGGARSEILSDGINGLLFEEDNSKDLAEKILILANDPALRQRMGAANRERFAAYYTHEHFGRWMVELLEKINA